MIALSSRMFRYTTELTMPEVATMPELGWWIGML